MRETIIFIGQTTVGANESVKNDLEMIRMGPIYFHNFDESLQFKVKSHRRQNRSNTIAGIFVEFRPDDYFDETMEIFLGCEAF